MSSKKPTILETRRIAKSRIFEIEELDLEFSNGELRTFERIRTRGPGAVIVIPLTDDQEILLVREYAAGLDRYELGLPKGLIDLDEDILETANRELMEEIGFGAAQLEFLITMNAAPGYMSNRLFVVLARQLYPQKLAGDEPEPIEVITWPLKNFELLLEREDFSHATTIAALYFVRDWLGTSTK